MSGLGYIVARGYVVLCALAVIFSTLASQALMPELYYDQGPVPPVERRVGEALLGLAYALLLLLPNRWSIRGWAFGVRLTLLLLASLWLGYIVASGVYAFLQGRKHWLIVPAAVVVLGLAILAPAALLAKRKLAAAR